jgi:SAM-dependent methyltransferase
VPDEALQRLTGLLTPAAGGGVLRVIDPCAGEGHALAAAARQLGGTPFAVELQRDRAGVCRDRFPYAIWGDAFRLRLTGGAFSLLWLNPPYDAGAAANGTYELKFLKELDRALAPDGVLVYLVPVDRLVPAAAYLSGHYADVRVWTFPQEEYEAYEQVAVVGRRLRTHQRNDELEAYLQAAGKGLIELDELPVPGQISISVPRVPAGDLTFESADVDEDALLEALNGKYSAWNHPGLQERLWPSAIYRANPLMPLQRGHLALLLAAGYLDNCLIDTAEGSLLVKGQIQKTVEEVENDPEAGRRRERERLLVSVNVLNLSQGTFTGYSGPRLQEFVTTYRDALTNAVVERFPAQYGVTLRELMPLKGALARAPIGGQGDAIRALAWAMKRHKGLILDGEMGCGKTYVATAAAVIGAIRLRLQLQRMFVTCPPHMVRKWAREIQTATPRANVVVIHSPGNKSGPSPLKQVSRAMSLPASPLSPLFIVCSREQLKLSYRSKPAAIERRVRGQKFPGVTELCCPDCWRPLLDQDGEVLTWSELQGHRVKCWCPRCREAGRRSACCPDCCGTVLSTVDVVPVPPGPGQPEFVQRPPVERRKGQPDLRRYEIARYLAGQYPRGAIDLFVCDECHEMKAESTAQGRAAGVLAEISRHSLVLSGSIYSGLASDLFYLLYRFVPSFREHFAYGDVARFVERFGVYEYVYTKIDARQAGEADLSSDVGAVSKRGNERVRRRERPGMSPAILLHVIGEAVFLRLEDIATSLPPYKEEVHVIDEDPELLSAYEDLADQFRQARDRASFGQRMRIAGAALQTLLSYPDTCTRPVCQTIKFGHSPAESVQISAPGLPAEVIYAKEQALVELLVSERSKGRCCLVYYGNTGVRDLAPRLVWLAEQAGLRADVLKVSVRPEAREHWIDQRVARGLDVLFANPSLVETGLDYMELSQASERN